MDGIRDKIDSMELLLYNENIDVACITEHNLKDFEKDNVIINNYTLSSIFCRSLYMKGGSAIFCKTSLLGNVKEITSLQKFCKEKIIEVCGIDLNFLEYTLRIITIYRSPLPNNVHMFIDELDRVLSYVCSNINSKIILCGDFNIDQLVNSVAKNELNDILSSYNILNLVNSATRFSNNIYNTATSIDYMCTNLKDSEVFCKVVPTAISDHTGQILSIEAERSPTDNDVYTRFLSKNNYDMFLSNISRETWDEVYICSNVNKAFEIFVNTLKYYIEVSFPFRKVNFKSQHCSKKDWLTKGIKISSNNLKKLYSKMIDTNDPDDILSYKKYKKIYKKVIRNSKRISNDNHYFNSENKSKAAWHIINKNVKNSTNRQIKELKTNNALVTNKKEMAHIFNDFFINVPKALNEKLIKHNSDPSNFHINNEYPSMIIGYISKQNILNIVKTLKKSNSSGMDGISTNIIKASIDYILSPLTYVVNLSLSHGIFPEILKVAKVVPLHKKGDTNNVENYRPVSLLSTISKILEKVIFISITNFVSDNGILHEAQHGFRKGKSTNSAIYDFLNTLYEKMDSNNKCVGLFLDLSKAFDLVDHALLLIKLDAYGIRGTINNLIKSYISNRSQLVEVDGVQSDKVYINYGVPQGSVLGPLLFLLFVNDLPDIENSKQLVMFADDNSYLSAKKNISDTILDAQLMLNKFIAWFNQNKLFVNASKTVFINFTPRLKNISESYLIKNNGRTIEQVANTKFLGLYLDNSLSWETHIDAICKKISSSCFALYRLRQISSNNVMLSFYYALIYSRLKYGILFWGCSHHSIRAFRLQKKAVRTIVGASRITSCREIFKKLNLLTLTSLYILETLLFVKQNLDKFNKNNYYHSYNTRRGNDLCLPIHTLAIYEKNPAYMGMLMYNKLPPHIKAIDNIKQFKSILRTYLIQQCFYSIEEYLG